MSRFEIKLESVAGIPPVGTLSEGGSGRTAFRGWERYPRRRRPRNERAASLRGKFAPPPCQTCRCDDADAEMDYQCIVVYTIITILPSKQPYPDHNDHQTGCLAWIKRWIKRLIFFLGIPFSLYANKPSRIKKKYYVLKMS